MTMKEIAGLAGVSITTVSKILNNKDEDISPETRNHVLKIIKEYHYVPYASIKNASGAKTFLIGVLLKSFPAENLLLKGILETAQGQGYSVLLCNSAGSTEEELRQIAALCKNNIDGLIWEPASAKSVDNEAFLEKADIPICQINSPFATESSHIDFERIGYQATKILLDFGHKKIACLTQSGSQQSRLVLEGFKKCLYQKKIAFSDTMELPIHGEDCYSSILMHGFTGILCTDFFSAQRLYGQLSRQHYRIPEDLSLLSLRDDGGDNLLVSRISTIKLSYLDFGKHVCERLISLCEKGDVEMKDFHSDCSLENEYSLEPPIADDHKKIVIVGSIHIDVTLNVDELPLSGRTISTNKYSIFPGGKGANQAIGAAKLGQSVSLIGKVGNDFDAALVYHAMEENHVDADGITRERNANTGKAYIHVQNDGESIITILAGANAAITAEYIREQAYIFANAGFCLLQTEISGAAIEEAAYLAKKNGAKTILKPTAQKSIADSLLKQIDLFVPSETEINILCPHTSDRQKQADYFLEKGVGTVIITLGHEGCYVKNALYEKSFPAIPFVAVDNTGAADAFIAALASYLLYGYPLEKAVQIATYAAGFCISRQGVVPALIDRNSLESYIKRTEPDLLLLEE